MVMEKAVSCGLAGNEISKRITGSSDVSPGRTAVATGAGAALGLVAAEVATVGLAAVGTVAAAPIAVPLALVSAGIAGIASLFR